MGPKLKTYPHILSSFSISPQTSILPSVMCCNRKVIDIGSLKNCVVGIINFFMGLTTWMKKCVVFVNICIKRANMEGIVEGLPWGRNMMALLNDY